METLLTVAVGAALWFWHQKSRPQKAWHEQVKEAEDTLRLDRYMRRDSLQGAELEQFKKEQREHLEVMRRMRWVNQPRHRPPRA